MDNSIEIWKDIEGYEGLYQISNMGRVKAMSRSVFNGYKPSPHKGRIMKFQDNGVGYKFVHLISADGTNRKFYVHRLVAQEFIPNVNNLPQVNHKDENPGNNAVWNLEWCTCKYNINYGNRMKKQLGKMVLNKKNNPIDVYDHSGNLVKSCDFAEEASSITKTPKQRIISECKGITCARSSFRFAFKGKKPFDKFERERKKFCWKVIKTTLDGDFVSEYKNTTEAERENNLNYRSLYKRTEGYKKPCVVSGFKYEFICD